MCRIWGKRCEPIGLIHQDLNFRINLSPCLQFTSYTIWVFCWCKIQPEVSGLWKSTFHFGNFSVPDTGGLCIPYKPLSQFTSFFWYEKSTNWCGILLTIILGDFSNTSLVFSDSWLAERFCRRSAIFFRELWFLGTKLTGRVFQHRYYPLCFFDFCWRLAHNNGGP